MIIKGEKGNLLLRKDKNKMKKIGRKNKNME